MTKDPIIKDVITAAGNGVELARRLGISSQAIYQWTVIPLERVPQIEKVTGISRHRLRPDFFDPPESSAA